MTAMQIVIVSVLVFLGGFFFLLAAVGVLRFPDFLTRTHAATKAGAFGGALLLAACAVAFPSFDVLVKALLTIVFFYLTSPIAAHILGRAAMRSGVPVCPQTTGVERRDEVEQSRNSMSSSGQS